MHSNRLGCLTITGIIATFITLIAIVGYAFASGSQMFSAGELSAQTGKVYGGVNSHAQIVECSGCHAPPFGTESMADRCAVCHTDIAAQMFDVAKLHGAISNKNPNLACRDCHPEHRGESAPLTDLKNNTFPHETLGFSLNGHNKTYSGNPFICSDCHLADIKTFTSDTCDSCHLQGDPAFEPAHSQAYGTTCLNCHDGVDRFSKAFNHAGFAFKLDGGHEGVACAKCHTGARTLTDFAGKAQDCYSCHSAKDAHNGAFGTNCGACHKPSNWKDATFDHNLSAFKLIGKHSSLRCEQCHINNVFKGTPADCYSCHKNNDKHQGQFGTDCSACHTPSSWSGATFDHNLSAFKLDGAHAQVRCEQCHINGVFKGTPTACSSCHVDPVFHAGAFGSECAACHNTSNWSQAIFNLSHPQPSGGDAGNGIHHGGATCRQCHPATVGQAVCTACHSSNNPGGG
jgi:hypothetical protein